MCLWCDNGVALKQFVVILSVLIRMFDHKRCGVANSLPYTRLFSKNKLSNYSSTAKLDFEEFNFVHYE